MFIFKRQPKPVMFFSEFEKNVKEALKKGEFVFFYQPEYDLKTKKVLGVEALLRWQHPEKGLIPPNDFIPLLEKTGLIHDITPFLFAQTMHDLTLIHETGSADLFMSVNLSVIQLQDKKLPDVIKKNLKQFKINPHQFECELTESLFMDNLSDDLKMLKKVRNLKVRLSIDDFGTGYSSFNYLRNINVQKLKIDREFISTLFDKKDNETILSAIIDLGHNLKLTVLAEGIETKQEEDWLQTHGCDAGQGFYFARPMPLEQLLIFLKEKQGKTHD